MSTPLSAAQRNEIDLGREVRRAAPLRDLERDQADVGRDPIDALAVDLGGGDIAADPGAVAVEVAVRRPAGICGQVLAEVPKNVAQSGGSSFTVKSWTWTTRSSISAWV